LARSPGSCWRSSSTSAAKGQDVEAKAGVKEAAQAMETCGIENSGIYDLAGAACDKPRLVAIEQSLADHGPRFVVDALGRRTYTVTVESERAPSEVSYSIRRQANGIVDQDCTVGAQDKGGCPSPGSLGDDW
jgi:hypothetical protein